MTPNYHIPLPPSFPLEQLNQAQQDHGAAQQQEKGNKYVSRDEPTEHSAMNSTLSLYTREHEPELVKEEKSGCVLSIKWMSSKMRLMKKMMKNDRIVLKKPRTISSNIDTDNSSSNNSSCDNDVVRTCSDCNTTKTPLWRSGPRGPKSLCNACGIRQRKARRALAAAQAENSDTLVASETSSTSGTQLHIKKKRCKLTARRSKKKLCFEDLVLSVSKNSAYYQVFPQDEKEAAILLMALSYGLAHA